jgi:hypothetical protein
MAICVTNDLLALMLATHYTISLPYLARLLATKYSSDSVHLP